MTAVRAISIAAVTAGLAATPALAQPEELATPPRQHAETETARTTGGDEQVHTAAEVAGAPAPGTASGVARGPERSGEWLLWIPRVALYPIRIVATAVGYPIRKGIYYYQVWDLKNRVKAIFFNEEGTAGLFPVAFAETGFGLNVGARLVLRELGSSDFKLNGRASFGGRFRQIYALTLSSEETWERLSFELGLVAEYRPKDLFFGIGNADLIDEPPAAPLDPAGGAAIESRFRQRALRANASGLYRSGPLRARLSAAFNDRTFNDADESDRATDESIVANYDRDQLTGFDEGSRHLYVEGELTFDTRRRSTPWEPAPMPTTGWKLQAFAGYAFAVDGDSSGYARYGADVQRYFRLDDGPRLIALRALIEGVTGDYGDVPFYDLPQIGGSVLLRGYDVDRFRDRIAAVASAEYQFDLSTRYLAGFLFVDTGRVYPSFDGFELSGLRLGYGGGLQVQSTNSFQGRLTLATSVDGGFFAFFNFDTIYDPSARVQRR